MKGSWLSFVVGPVLEFVGGLIEKSKERKEKRRLEQEAQERAEAEKEYIEGKRTDVMPLPEVNTEEVNQ